MVSTRVNSALIISLSLILGFTILIIFGYTTQYKYISSGFAIERITIIFSQYSQNDSVFVYGLETIPYSSAYILITHIVSSLNELQVFYFPTVFLLGSISIIIFFRTFFGDNHTSLSIFLLSPIFYVFLQKPHYVEYSISSAFYLLFISSSYRLLLDTNLKWGIVSILTYLGTKFFGPPMELWAITFVVGTFIVLTLQQEKNKIFLRTWKELLVVIIVMFFAYNPKIYSQFLTRWIWMLSSPENSIYILISSILNKPSTEPFVVFPTPSLKAITYLKVLYFSISLLAPLLMILCIKKKTCKLDTQKAVFLLILLIVFFEDFILYSILGLPTIRYIVLVYPLIVIGWYSMSLKYCRVKYRYIMYIILVMLFVSGIVTSIFSLTDSYRFYPESASDFGGFIIQKGTDRTEILTDFVTYTTFEFYSYENTGSWRTHNLLPYSSERYHRLVEGRWIEKNRDVMLVISMENLHKPIFQGPPKWTYFEPLGKYYTQIPQDTYLSKIYDNQQYLIFMQNN